MSDTPTPNDGSIEANINAIIEPETPETEEPEEVSQEYTEEVADSAETDDEPADEAADSEGDAEDENDTEETEAPKEPLYTVKVDGKEKEVTLEELKRGYSGQEYVQKGMQEAAAMRKQTEEVYAALLNERQQLTAMYQQLQSGQFATPPQAPSRELFDSDPIGYMEAKLNYDEKMSAWQQQNAQMQNIMAQQTKAQEAARHAYLQQELQSLRASIPEFADAKQSQKLLTGLVETGKVYGYTPEEIGQAVDHRALRVLRDAMKYQEIMAGKEAADKKVAAGVRPKAQVVKAGAKKVSNPSKQIEAQRNRLRQTGRLEDAVSLLFQR